MAWLQILTSKLYLKVTAVSKNAEQTTMILIGDTQRKENLTIILYNLNCQQTAIIVINSTKIDLKWLAISVN